MTRPHLSDAACLKRKHTALKAKRDLLRQQAAAAQREMDDVSRQYFRLMAPGKKPREFWELVGLYIRILKRKYIR